MAARGVPSPGAPAAAASSSASASASAAASVCGWVTKEGQVVHSWKRRWAVLRGDKIFYYDGPEEGLQARGVIVVSNAVVDRSAATHCKNPYSFAIQQRPMHLRKFHMFVDTEEERRRWVESLTDVLKLATAAGVYDLYCGALLKKNARGFCWRQRFFVLKNQQLYYYYTNDNRDSAPRGMVNLRGAQLIVGDTADRECGRVYSMVIVPELASQRRMRLAAASRPLFETWSSHLRSIIASSSADSGGPAIGARSSAITVTATTTSRLASVRAETDVSSSVLSSPDASMVEMQAVRGQGASQARA